MTSTSLGRIDFSILSLRSDLSSASQISRAALGEEVRVAMVVPSVSTRIPRLRKAVGTRTGEIFRDFRYLTVLHKPAEVRPRGRDSLVLQGKFWTGCARSHGRSDQIRMPNNESGRDALARTIYDKPTRALLKDMLADWGLKSGETFSAQRAIDWFAEHYPKLKAGSIHAHLVQASTNDRSRLHHPATNVSDDLLFKVGSREYRRFEPTTDPAPLHQAPKVQIANANGKVISVTEEEDDAGVAIDAALAGSSQFALEKDLQRYLADNLQLIEPGLTLFQDEEITGFEYPAGGGRRIDILAKDRSGGFVVLELKVEKGYDRVVGQLLRYVNWVRKELAEPGQRVRGIIVCRSMSEDLILACSGIKDVELFEYRLQVTVSKVPLLELP